MCDKVLQCVECLRQVHIEKLEPSLLNDLQISIKRRVANTDGRKDFRMKIVDGRLRMKWKLEDRYAASCEGLPYTYKSELSCSLL